MIAWRTWIFEIERIQDGREQEAIAPFIEVHDDRTLLKMFRVWRRQASLKLSEKRSLVIAKSRHQTALLVKSIDALRLNVGSNKWKRDIYLKAALFLDSRLKRRLFAVWFQRMKEKKTEIEKQAEVLVCLAASL